MKVGFIGFGEAGFTIGHGLRGAGLEELFAYDNQATSADRGPLIRDRAATAGARLVASPAELAATASILISTVTCSSALDAARQHAPFLHGQSGTGGPHLYADLNSVSPDAKRQIAGVVDASGAAFVEAAVMAPVGPYAQRVPMLLGGPGADAFVRAMRPFDMRLQILPGAAIGTAAAVKMCRSIVVKGLEALLAECVLGSSEYGATAHVFASLQESYPGIDWQKLADYNINRLVVHGERRAREMEEVAGTLREAGIDPIMAEATARRQDWGAKLGLKEQFPPDGPKSAQEVLDVLATLRRTARCSSTAVTLDQYGSVMRRSAVGLAPVIAAVLGPSLSAHHTVANSYDVSRAVTLSGVVTEVMWKNPHAIYHLSVPDGAGGSVDWEIESRHLQGMRDYGVNVDTIHTGDRVSMSVFLAIDRSHRAATESITLPDGRTVRVCTVTNDKCP